MVRNKFDKELYLLNTELIEMGSIVEWSIENAAEALIKKDVVLARQVIAADEEINHIEKKIESRCLNLILRQQPVARDLRLISSILKMITDLERIGDQAQDISEITIRVANQVYIKEITHIPEMAKATIRMVKDSIDAFINNDISLAKEVIISDDIVDDLFDIIKDELIYLIRDNVENGEQAIDLLMISKYFERIGDHAENIAEWVLFSITGKHSDDSLN